MGVHQPAARTGLRSFALPTDNEPGAYRKARYLHSFPHLLGCVSCLDGKEADIRALVERRKSGSNWTDALAASDLVLTPAACYPVYPIAAERGNIPASGLKFDIASYCFRREATYESDRLQAFRMREFVCIGNPEQASEFRARWLSRATDIANRLGLPHTVAPASDPFFGRVGKLAAMMQIEQALKFEMLIPVNSEEQPTACMSFNCHREHFGEIWGTTLGEWRNGAYRLRRVRHRPLGSRDLRDARAGSKDLAADGSRYAGDVR